MGPLNSCDTRASGGAVNCQALNSCVQADRQPDQQHRVLVAFAHALASSTAIRLIDDCNADRKSTWQVSHWNLEGNACGFCSCSSVIIELIDKRNVDNKGTRQVPSQDLGGADSASTA